MLESRKGSVIKKVFKTLSTSPSSRACTSTFHTKAGVKEGWLRKQGGVVRSWQRLWFHLTPHMLQAYSAESLSKLLFSVNLADNRVKSLPNDKPGHFLFEIQPLGEPRSSSCIMLSAESEDERHGWIRSLRRVMHLEKGGAIFGQSLQDTMKFENRLNKDGKVPHIVQLCIEFLYEHGLTVKGIFRLPGRTQLIKDLQECFDCAEAPNFSAINADVHSVASILKLYLRELPDSLLPHRFYEQATHLATAEIHRDVDAALRDLSFLLIEIDQENYFLLQYLCHFLFKVSTFSEENKMTAMNLATIFAQSIVRPPSDDPALLMGTSHTRTQLTFLFISEWMNLFHGEAADLFSARNSEGANSSSVSSSGDARFSRNGSECQELLLQEVSGDQMKEEVNLEESTDHSDEEMGNIFAMFGEVEPWKERHRRASQRKTVNKSQCDTMPSFGSPTITKTADDNMLADVFLPQDYHFVNNTNDSAVKVVHCADSPSDCEFQYRSESFTGAIVLARKLLSVECDVLDLSELQKHCLELRQVLQTFVNRQ